MNIMDNKLKGFMDIRAIILKYQLSNEEARILISENTNLGAFLELRNAIADNRLTQQEAETLIDQVTDSLNQSIPKESQPKIPGGEDR